MINVRSTHANFSVDDLSAAKNFYINTVGLTLSKEDENGLVLESASGSMINIYLKEDHVPWDSTVLGIEVPDVSIAVGELASSGVYVEKVPGTDENGIMHDPSLGSAAWLREPHRDEMEPYLFRNYTLEQITG